MSYLFGTKQQDVKQEAPLLPPFQLPTKEELRVVAAKLPYAIPGLYTSVKALASKRAPNKKGKRGTVSRTAVPRILSPMQAMSMNKPFNVVQTIKLGRLTTSTTIELDGAYSFAFSDISQSASWTAVFDQYRFVMIELTFLPTIEALASGGQSALFYSAVDTDDASSTTAASIRDYPDCQTTECWKPHKHTWQPHVAIAAYAGAFTSFANETSPWIDVASPSVQHYGLKYAFDVCTVAFSYDVIGRIHLQMRNVR